MSPWVLAIDDCKMELLSQSDHMLYKFVNKTERPHDHEKSRF